MVWTSSLIIVFLTGTANHTINWPTCWCYLIDLHFFICSTNAVHHFEEFFSSTEFWWLARIAPTCWPACFYDLQRRGQRREANIPDDSFSFWRYRRSESSLRRFLGNKQYKRNREHPFNTMIWTPRVLYVFAQPFIYIHGSMTHRTSLMKQVHVFLFAHQR